MPPPNPGSMNFGSQAYGPLPMPTGWNLGMFGTPGQGQNQTPRPTLPTFNAHSGGGIGYAQESIRKYNEQYNDWLKNSKGGGGPNLLSQIAMAGFSDASRMQNAANFQWDRMNQQIGGIGDFISSQVPLFQKYAGEQADALKGIASGLTNGMTADMAAFDKFRDKTLDELRGDIDASVSTAQGAANEFAGAIKDYKDVGFHDAQIMASGIRESYHQQMQMVNAGLRPDGTRMTPGEQFQAKQAALESMTRSAASAAQPMITKVNENLLQANSRLADLRNITSGLQMQGAALQSGTATQFSGQRVELEAQQNAMKQFAASLNATASGLAGAAHLNAINFEMGGRQLMAQLTMQNPLTVVGLMPIFAQMLGLATAPGAANVPGLNMAAIGSAVGA